MFAQTVKSSLKHLVDMEDLYLVCAHKEELENAYNTTFGPRVKYVDERDLPVKMNDVTRIIVQTAAERKEPKYPINGHSPLENMMPGKKGWYLQQVLKFYAGSYLGLQDVVVLDSDLVWHRDVYFKYRPAKRHGASNQTTDPSSSSSSPGHVLHQHHHTATHHNMTDAPPEEDGGLPRYYYAYGSQYHVPYFAVMKMLTGLKPTIVKKVHYSGVVHHMVFVKEVMEDMRQDIEKRHGIPMWQALLNCSSKELISHYPVIKQKLSGAGSVLSEYELYFHYARNKWPQTMVLRPLLFANGPAPNVQFFPKTTDGSIPPDSLPRSPHWNRVRINQFIKTQVRADALSGYDYNGYHGYSSRRYFEMHSADVVKDRVCAHLPKDRKPTDAYNDTTCSFKGFNPKKHDEHLWFRDCLCYMYRNRACC